MSYTVTWKKSAVNKLAEIWQESTNRDAVTNAANAIDVLLSQSPDDVGESRQENTRFLFVSPLAIYFDVLPDDKKVVVWSVWRRQSK